MPLICGINLEGTFSFLADLKLTKHLSVQPSIQLTTTKITKWSRSQYSRRENGWTEGGRGYFCNLNTKNLIHHINIMFSVDYTRFTMRHYTIQQVCWQNYATRRKEQKRWKIPGWSQLTQNIQRKQDGFCLAKV